MATELTQATMHRNKLVLIIMMMIMISSLLFGFLKSFGKTGHDAAADDVITAT